MNRTYRFALALSLAAATLTGAARADVAQGEKVFRKCKACHTIGPEAKARVGPALNDIVDAAAARDADYTYSEALAELAAEGLTWDRETLAAFLTKPRDVVPGTKMSFSGLRKPEDVSAVIGYLATFD
ncbi:MAG: cytochrome c family protein [Rhodobacteraceae bacterium]|nr:cytochrome c family protein [Paracoccaceae bacterium]MBO29009.1 cytochrome c family protein [Paracoccaceae bacterium]